MKSLYFIIFSFFFSLTTSKLFAQDCGCGAALAQDKIEASSAGFEYLHSLQDLDKYEYNKIKQSAGGGFKYKLIKGSANYEEFTEMVKSEIHSMEVETGMQYETKYYEARTNPIAYQFWNDCMRRCNETGLLLWIQNESKKNVAIELKYVSQPGIASPLKYIIQIQHGDGTVEEKNGEILPGGSEPISIPRRCGSDDNGISQTLISAKGGGLSTGWLPPSKFYCGTPPPQPPINEFEKTMVSVTSDLVGKSSFFIGKFEVTQEQWQKIMGDNPGTPPNCSQCPINNISWGDVQEFLQKLNRLFPDKKYRLPTESEWEYAAKGGNRSNGYKYSGGNLLTDVGWYNENSDPNNPHEVGEKKPNELGLYDMSGNVYELCSNLYNPGNPKSERVVKGGSCATNADYALISHRGNWGGNSQRSFNVGFRIARNN